MYSNNFYYFFIIFIIIFVIYFILNKTKLFNKADENDIDITKLRIKSYIINMDKNKDRLENVQEKYEKSDLRIIPYERFPAVVGKNIDIHEWLTEEAIVELKQVENKKYRNYHYQLSRGGIGCFLSHYALAKQLLEDDKYDYYFNLEDDIYIADGCMGKIKIALKNVNPDWDFIIFGYHRLIYSELTNKYFARISGFWGTHGVLMNKKGAKAFVDEVDKNKIDGQIDAYMSRMAQQGKIAIYGFLSPVFYTYNDVLSDIQVPIKPKKDIDPFNFRGYNV